MSPFSFSDYPCHCGGHHHPPADLPQEEDPHCCCSHQRSQQVSLHIRAVGTLRWWNGEVEKRSMKVKMLNVLTWNPFTVAHGNGLKCLTNGTGLGWSHWNITHWWWIGMTVAVVCVYRAIGHVMSSLFYPLFTFLLLAMVIAYWATTAVYPFTLLPIKVSI